jgi:uncharacterized protein
MESIVLVAFFAIALLYSAVGHGGASSFLALMSILGVSTALMRPAALTLNIAVASIAALSFIAARQLPAHNAKSLLPLCASGVICAFLGAQVSIAKALFDILLAAFLIISALALAAPGKLAQLAQSQVRSLSSATALSMGAVLGFLAGLTGIGGGVLLSPILVLGGYASVRASAAMSAVFIVLNSTAGALSLVQQDRYSLPASILPWLFAAIAGGLIGAYLGARVYLPPVLKRLLAVVLLLAAARVLTL